MLKCILVLYYSCFSDLKINIFQQFVFFGPTDFGQSSHPSGTCLVPPFWYVPLCTHIFKNLFLVPQILGKLAHTIPYQAPPILTRTRHHPSGTYPCIHMFLKFSRMHYCNFSGKWPYIIATLHALQQFFIKLARNNCNLPQGGENPTPTQTILRHNGPHFQ